MASHAAGQRRSLPQGLSAAAAACLVATAALAQVPTAQRPAEAEWAIAAEPIVNSELDDRLLYQLLVGEMALNAGDAGSAYELMLDAARRTRDDSLFRRAVNIALQARAGEQALAATRAWRLAAPRSAEAMRLQLQILVLLNRPRDVAEPLRQLLAQTLPADLDDLISALPRLLQRASDQQGVAQIIDDALRPYRSGPTAVQARVAQGRAWAEAREPARALVLVQEARALDARAPGPVLLALELARELPAAEAVVTRYLQQPDAEPELHLGYVRMLSNQQRFAEAVRELQLLTARQPASAPPWLSLGALQLEVKQPAAAQLALQRYLALAEAAPGTAAASGSVLSKAAASPRIDAETANDSSAAGDDEDAAARPDQGPVQARLLLAQAAEQLGDYAGAERWLAGIDTPGRALEVQVRRASVLGRQGRWAEARALLRAVPETGPDDARAKLLAEAGLLREARRWSEAYEVLGSASQRFPQDPDLLYEQAMMAEKSGLTDDMEALLRQVIALKPDNANAHNALGYSLADRQQRLPEARALITRALELAPGDPFITDSLAWVEFRSGNAAEALRLLQGAYRQRADPEIAAHLGEVLWSSGRRDEARQVWQEGRQREPGNEVLQETQRRLDGQR